MTTVFDTLKNVGGELESGVVTFLIPEVRQSSTGAATVTMRRHTVSLVNGAFSTSLEPGLVHAQFNGKRRPLLVPASGSHRMGALIDAYIPPTSDPNLVQRAVDRYLTLNPPPAVKGDTGPTGPAGPAGVAGPKGDTGATGPAGATGPQGQGIQIKGRVATYANLPTSGNVSGDSWVVTADGLLYIYGTSAFPSNGNGVPFKGDKGDTGATGPAGATGSTGPKGDTGAKGDAGAQGPAGSSTVDGLTDATTVGKALVKASNAAAARDAIGAVSVDAAAGLSQVVDTKYVKPANGIPESDLATAAQTKLTRANSAVLTVNGAAPDGSGNVTVAGGGGASIASLVNQPEGSREHPVASKPLTDAWVTLADQSATSLYWPQLVDLSAAGGTGYLLLWSTDHTTVTAESGTFAMWCPFPGAPKAQCKHLGKIYLDSTNGTQCETPTMIWNPTTSKWHLYYQMASPTAKASQATYVTTTTQAAVQALITSNTAVPWTTAVLAIDATQAASPIPGDTVHQGYATVFRIAGEWMAINLNGGTYGGFARKFSQDGFTWYSSGTSRMANGGPNMMSIAGYDPATWVFKWTWSNIIQWRGLFWVIGAVGAEAAGQSTPGQFRIVAAPWSDDRRGLGAVPLDITPAAQGWESSPIDTVGQGAVYNGKFYIPYRSNQKTGAFSLMVVQ